MGQHAARGGEEARVLHPSRAVCSERAQDRHAERAGCGADRSRAQAGGVLGDAGALATVFEARGLPEVCICSPLRRAMETAALVFENEPTVPIECTRFARERWWTWYQCIGSEYQETVDFAAGLGRRILGLDTLNSLDQFWNPVEEIAAISRLQSECANFEERKRRYEPSARELEANHPHELTNYLARHEADVIAVACHWGVSMS